MILTGKAIKQAVEAGEVIIDPLNPDNLNPNSYNYHLGSAVIKLHRFDTEPVEQVMELSSQGYLLTPGNVYLGHTKEVLGSNKYAMTLLGRSSTGRLGLFLNITANLGHVGSCSQWTLEMTVVQPLRIYPGMKIGQIAFWQVCGDFIPYFGRYNDDRGPVVNKDSTLILT